MPRRHPVQSAGSRGSLNARQWQDIRQAARVARSEGVTITWRRDGSIAISPAPVSASTPHKAGNQLREQERSHRTTRDAVAQPMDTAGSETIPSKKQLQKQERDAGRAEANRALKASPQLARWQLLSKRLLWTARKDTCNAIWTAWMRSRDPEARLEARRKVRNVFWREWTRPQIEPPPLPTVSPGSPMRVIATGLQVIGARSMRDEYILKRSRAFINS